MKKALALLSLAAVIAIGASMVFRKPHLTVSAHDGQNEEPTRPPVPALNESQWEERQFPEGPKHRINLSTATFLFDIEPWTEGDAKTASRLLPSYGAAYDAVDGRPESFLTSVDVVVGLAKFQEDEILAELEMAVLHETRRFLELLAKKLAERGKLEPASHGLEAALGWALAGNGLANPPFHSDNRLANAILRNFFARKALSEPRAFYGESADLTSAWRTQKFLTAPFVDLFDNTQVTEDDRWLAWAAIYQTLATEQELRPLFAVLSRWSGTLEESTESCSGESLLAHLRSSLGVPGKWTDPSAVKACFKAQQAWFPTGLSFLPAAIPVENIFVSLAQQQGKDTMEGVIKGFAQSPLFSTIQESSGWYARQRYALLPLIRPGDSLESYKLALTKAYTERLRKAFSSSLTKVRETHQARQLPLGSPLSSTRKPEVYLLKPELDLEPQATVYLRQAEAARWLRARLTGEFQSTLGGIGTCGQPASADA